MALDGCILPYLLYLKKGFCHMAVKGFTEDKDAVQTEMLSNMVK